MVHPGQGLPFGLESQGRLSTDQTGAHELQGYAAADGLELFGLPRAVQALPGVTASDDKRAEFSVRGSGPRNIGVTFEGVTTDLLVHRWHREDDGSASMLNSTVVDALALQRGAYAQRVGGRTGAWLDATMREGPRDRVEARASVAMTSSSVVFGGPLGASKRGSYLVAGRINYIDRLLELLGASGGTAGFSMLDAQGKAVYDLDSPHQVQLAWVGGQTRLNLENEREGAGPGDDRYTINRTGLATAALRSTFGSRLVTTHRVAVVGNHRWTDGFFLNDLARSTRTELSYRGDLMASAFKRSMVEAGFATNRASQAFESTEYGWSDSLPLAVRPGRHDEFDARAWQHGGYVLLRWHERPTWVLSPGVRVDRFSLTRQTAVSPWFQISWTPAAQWNMTLAGAVSRQFPDFAQVAGAVGGGSGLRAEDWSG